MAESSIPGKIIEETNEDETRAPFKEPEAPSDFESTQTFLQYATALFDNALDYDKVNREQAIDDAKFMTGEQWDKSAKASRIGAKKPVLVFNHLPAFVGQIVGNRRLNETVIKIVPDDTGAKDVAKIREGLVRSIQKISRADLAYNKALENQVINGMGNFEVALEYASDDVFEQDIKIKAINNSFSVVWDPTVQDPTGEDAKYVFIVDTMPKVDFEDQWPKATAGDAGSDTRLLGYDLDSTWITEDHVRVVRMWRMRSHKRIVALLEPKEGEDEGQQVEDVTDLEPDEYADRLVLDANGIPVMREVDRKYAQLYTFTSMDILEGPYELPIPRVPVFAVPGWEINIGHYKSRFGLIRFLKDPQRLLNYWRSIIAEKLMMTPKANWVASIEAVEGREKQWQQSHLSDDPLLIYNGEAGAAPTRVQAAQIEPALIEQSNSAAQALRDISNLHEASLGIQSNEVSGKAIIARQRVGEVGTVVYQDNLDLAIEAGGRVINALIPFVYDTARTIKILGEDGEEFTPIVINDSTDQQSVDITVGKYVVSSSTGPSYVTKRIEAQDGMLNMVNAMPETLAVAADKIVEAQDWPGAEEIARRLRLTLPPGMISEADLSPNQKKQAQLAAEVAAQEQAHVDQLKLLDLEMKQAQVNQANGLATQAEANAAKALADIEIDQFKAIADVEDSRVKRVLDTAQFLDVTP